MQEYKITSISVTLHTTHSELVKDLNVKFDKMELLEETIGSNLYDPSLENDFLKTTSFFPRIKANNL